MTNTEIGGYLEMENFHGTPYHREAIALNCGRGALAYLIELRQIKKIWLPDYMCDSVRRLFLRESVCVNIYRIGPDFAPVYDFKLDNGDWMLLNDAYGQLTAKDVDVARQFSREKLIIDETQAFFRPPWNGADTIYSLRKWFGVPDGSYLVTGDGKRLGRDLEQDESHTRMAHVLGRYERPASEFFRAACENNEFFDREPAKRMSRLTENLMRGIDWNNVIKRRSENWDVLTALLERRNLLSPTKPEAPFMYPMLVENAGDIRRRLAMAGLFVPKLWPNVSRECASDTVAFRYAENILPVPLDQRYGEKEMRFAAKVLINTMDNEEALK